MIPKFFSFQYFKILFLYQDFNISFIFLFGVMIVSIPIFLPCPTSLLFFQSRRLKLVCPTLFSLKPILYFIVTNQHKLLITHISICYWFRFCLFYYLYFIYTYILFILLFYLFCYLYYSNKRYQSNTSTCYPNNCFNSNKKWDNTSASVCTWNLKQSIASKWSVVIYLLMSYLSFLSLISTKKNLFIWLH